MDQDSERVTILVNLTILLGRVGFKLPNPTEFESNMSYSDKKKQSVYFGEWLSKNRERRAEYNRQWRRNNREKCVAYEVVASKKYKEKRRIRDLARAAVKSGTILKKPCLICGAKKVEAHHTDYKKPLFITWLCVKHHHFEHAVYAQE